jgi:uncharacterized protein YbaR (Trm112 family)
MPSIYFYNDVADYHLTMYVIVRCPGCRTFSYVDRYQRWKLCPVCGQAYEVSRVPAYLEVEDHVEAEHIVRQLEKYLHTMKRKDLTVEEMEDLRRQYAMWVRKKI